MSKTMTTAEIAEYFGTNVGKVCKWINDGELQAINIAQNRSSRAKYRVTEEQLRAFEKSRTVGAPDPQPKRRKRDTESVPNYV